MYFKSQEESMTEIKKLAVAKRQSVVIEGPSGCGKSYLSKEYANLLEVSDYMLVTPKVAEIREMDKRVYIQIDGGVTLKNVSILRRMGANIIVSSKAIFEAKNMKKAIKTLKGGGFINRIFEDI